MGKNICSVKKYPKLSDVIFRLRLEPCCFHFSQVKKAAQSGEAQRRTTMTTRTSRATTTQSGNDLTQRKDPERKHPVFRASEKLM